MLIAIIDDGIDQSKLKHHNLKCNFIVDSKNDTLKPQESGVRPPTDHGTTCTQIIEEYAPDAYFISISVFGDAILKTTCKRLFMALLWCLDNKIPLVHMSVGTELLHDSLLIRPVIARMLMQGQIIVAARSNKGNYTIPACLGGVIEVIADEELTGFSYHACHSDNGILIKASSRHSLTDSLVGMTETFVANSYAAPTVTAAVHNILKLRKPYSISVPSIYNELSGGSLTYQPTRADFIEDACVLNLSGTKLLYQRFFFSFREEYTTVQEFVDHSAKGKSLVLVPSSNSEDNKRVMEFLKNKQKQWKGFLFAGSAERENKWIRTIPNMEQILNWSEDNCRILRWIHFKENIQENLTEHVIPIVFIVDDDGRGIELACELLERFQKEGYQCMRVSNHTYSYLYGFEYIPPEISLQMATHYVNDIYEPDLAIFHVTQKSMNEMIRQDEDNYIIEYDTETQKKEIRRNQSVIRYCYDKNELENLFQKITEYFI